LNLLSKTTNNTMSSYSRDFTYIENVIQANELAAITPNDVILKNLKCYFKNTEVPNIIYEVFNVAYGGNTTLIELYDALRTNLAKFDPEISNVDPIHGLNRQGDIPHSLASIEKGKNVLGYNPEFDARKGFEKACEWYYKNLK